MVKEKGSPSQNGVKTGSPSNDGAKTFVTEFCDILIKNKIVQEKEADALKKTFKASDQENFDEFLIDEGLMEPEDVLRALSLYYKVPAVDVKGFLFEHFLVTKFPKEFLLRNTVIPYEVEENMLFVVASRPEEGGLESAMRDFVSYDIEFMVGLAGDIRDAIEEFYDKAVTMDAEGLDMDRDEEKRKEKEMMSEEEDLDKLGYSDIIYRDDEESEEE